MRTTVVGIAEFRVAETPETLITYALGSCIALTAWDPAERVGGLLHFMLPDSSADSRRGTFNPAAFADTGIPLLIEECVRRGAERRRMVVNAAGGARVLDNSRYFDIGHRNQLSMRKACWKAGVLIHREFTGGTVFRSVSLNTDGGQTMVREGTSPWKSAESKEAR